MSDHTPPSRGWEQRDCPVCKGRGTVVKTYDEYGMADPKDVPCWFCLKMQRMLDAARSESERRIAEVTKELEVEREKHDEEAYTDMAAACDVLRAQVSDLRAQVDRLTQEKARYENAQCIACGAHLDLQAENASLRQHRTHVE